MKSNIYRTMSQAFTGCAYLFLYVPLLLVFLYSFAQLGEGLSAGLTTQWYADLLSSADIRQAFVTSILLA